jgi:hypothetical protein
MAIGLYNNILNNQDSYLYSSTRSNFDVTKPLESDYFVDSNVRSNRILTYGVSVIAPNAAGFTDVFVKTYNIKLCDLIPNSFFSINRNIYSSSVLYLRLETNTLS